MRSFDVVKKPNKDIKGFHYVAQIIAPQFNLFFRCNLIIL